MTANYEKFLETALAAAEKAGKILKDYHYELVKKGETTLDVSTKANARDYVTKADKAVQKIIINRIIKDFPGHNFLGEEGNEKQDNRNSPYRWIIDPLDGTLPFIHKKPNFGTIIALEENGLIVAGVMLAPLMNQTFFGFKGGGAYINGERCVLRQTKNLDDSILASNLIHRAQVDDQGTMHITSPVCASLENYGNALQEFGEILLGRNDGAFFYGPRLWDVAAGCLLVEEAGGKARYELKDKNDQRGPVLCVAATKPIFRELEKFVFEDRLY